MSSGRDKDAAAVLRKVRRLGYTVTRTTRGHWQVRSGERLIATHSGTGGKGRGHANFIAELRRSGVKI